MLISRLTCYLTCCLQCNTHHLVHLPASSPGLPQDWEARSLVHHRSDFQPGTDRARPALPPASCDLLFYFQYSTDVRILIFAVFIEVSQGRIPLPNWMNFLKNSKRHLTPRPLIFGKLYCKFFIMNMVAFMQGGIGHIVSVNINTIVEKTYPEP